MNAYKHCLLCGSQLNKEGDRILVCSNCGHQHFINPNPCNAVIIENEKGEILLVKRKFEPQKDYWDLAGGFINPGENLEESVKREIFEELKVEIEMNTIVGVYHDVYVYQGIELPTIGIVVSAHITKGTPTPSDDASEYKYFSKSEVLNQKIAFKSVEQGLKDYLKK